MCDERTQSCVAVDEVAGPDNESHGTSSSPGDEGRDAGASPQGQPEAGVPANPDASAAAPPPSMANPDEEFDAGGQEMHQEPDAGGGQDSVTEPPSGTDPMPDPAGCGDGGPDPAAGACDPPCPGCAFSSPTQDISLAKACWAPGEFMPVTIHIPRAVSDWLWVQNHPDYGGKDEEFWDHTGIVTPGTVYRGGEREPGGLHAPSEAGAYRITWHPWDAWDEYVHSAVDFTVSSSCP